MTSSRSFPRRGRLDRLRPPSAAARVPTLVIAVAMTVAIGGCGAAPAPAPPAASAPTGRSPATAEAPAAPPATPGPADRAIARSALRAVVGQGLGAFLRHVELDDRPVLVGGRFHGFRIVALRDPAFWRGVDLRPGDVVTSINGLPIERPDQAQTAFDSLEVASELRVAFDRDGRPSELVYRIVDGR